MAQRAIDAADRDPTKNGLFVGSLFPYGLALRGSNRVCLGITGFRKDFDDAIAMTRSSEDTSTYVASVLLKYGFPVHNGVLLPDATALQETANALDKADRFGDDFARDAARLARGLVLVNQTGQQRTPGLQLMTQYHGATPGHGYSQWLVRFINTETAKERARVGDLVGAIALARETAEFVFGSGDMISLGPAVTVLVESLLRRGAEGDLTEAEATVERLAAVPTDPGYVLLELPLLRLRALLARAKGDEAGYRDFADRYRRMANDFGFEGHMAIAEAMT